MILKCVFSYSYFSTISNDIDINIGAEIKLDKKNTSMTKIVMMTPYQQILASSLVFQFMANLEQFVDWMPNAWAMQLQKYLHFH